MIIRNLNEIDEVLKKKKVAVFDLDGTLIDSEPLHFKAHNEVLKEGWGIELSETDILKYIGFNEVKICHMFEEEYNIEIDADDYAKKRVGKYIEMSSGIEPYSFMKEFFENYNIKPFLLTSQKEMVYKPMFTRWGWDEIFPEENRISLQNNNKTKQEVYEDFINKFGKENIIIFEDAIGTLRSARELGLDHVAVMQHFNKNLLDEFDIVLKPIEMNE